MIGLVEPSIALAFDLQCGRMLLEFEREQEDIRLEAMSAGVLSRTLGVQTQASPINSQLVGEITPANFRDQGF